MRSNLLEKILCVSLFSFLWSIQMATSTIFLCFAFHRIWDGLTLQSYIFPIPMFWESFAPKENCGQAMQVLCRVISHRTKINAFSWLDNTNQHFIVLNSMSRILGPFLSPPGICPSAHPWRVTPACFTSSGKDGTHWLASIAWPFPSDLHCSMPELFTAQPNALGSWHRSCRHNLRLRVFSDGAIKLALKLTTNGSVNGIRT